MPNTIQVRVNPLHADAPELKIDSVTMHPEEEDLHIPRVDSQIRERGGNEDVANPGFVRPPFVYLAAILAGAGLHLVRPLHWLPDGIGPWVGVPLVLISLALFVASTRQFKAADTPVPGNRPATAIVGSGPYRLSRNPIYLAFSALVLGIACWLNSLWLLATLGASVSLMNFIVIPREERYLERRFGAEYLEYRTKVRRWI